MLFKLAYWNTAQVTSVTNKLARLRHIFSRYTSDYRGRTDFKLNDSFELNFGTFDINCKVVFFNFMTIKLILAKRFMYVNKENKGDATSYVYWFVLWYMLDF